MLNLDGNSKGDDQGETSRRVRFEEAGISEGCVVDEILLGQAADRDVFITDSGATTHVVNYFRMLHNPERLDPPHKIRQLSGEILAHWKGTVYMIGKNKEEQPVKFALFDALLVPGPHVNLYSTQRLWKSGGITEQLPKQPGKEGVSWLRGASGNFFARVNVSDAGRPVLDASVVYPLASGVCGEDSPQS